MPIRPSVFLSYARPDLLIALQLKAALEEFADVFIDVDMRVSTEWASQIKDAIANCDIFIFVLTPISADERDMVHAEVEAAWRRNKEQRKPLIAPIRVNYRDDLALPLSGYLNRFQAKVWESSDDLRRIVKEIADLFGINSELFRPGQRPILPQRRTEVFIDRGFESRARQHVQGVGETIVIKGPRQSGKTRLQECIADAARAAGKHVASLDFQNLDSDALLSGDKLFAQFNEMFTHALGLASRVEDFSKRGLPRSENCSIYVENYILAELSSPVMLIIDEADRLIEPKSQDTAPFRIDFFRMLRTWHQMRKPVEKSVWNRLDLILVTATEPYLLIPEGSSPFNVAGALEFVPTDFEISEVARLNREYLRPIHDEMKLFELLAGHPGLTQQAMYMVRSHQLTEKELFDKATSDSGPFASHLRYYMFRLSQVPDLMSAFCKLVRYKIQPPIEQLYRLEGAGLVKEQGDLAVPRCKLYADFFKKRLKC